MTLIDFTLSRATTREQKDEGEGEQILFDALEDECLFEGEGDAQFEVYRQMRDVVGGEWDKFHPITNVMVRPEFPISRC